MKDYDDDEPRPPLLATQNRYREFFNAAALFRPADIRDGRLPTDLSQMYAKRRLMQFLEQVPFSEQFPPLAELIIPIGVRPRRLYIYIQRRLVKYVSFHAVNFPGFDTFLIY